MYSNYFLTNSFNKVKPIAFSFLIENKTFTTSLLKQCLNTIQQRWSFEFTFMIIYQHAFSRKKLFHCKLLIKKKNITTSL